MGALRSAPTGLVFFLLTLTYMDVGNWEVTPKLAKIEFLPCRRSLDRNSIEDLLMGALVIMGPSRSSPTPRSLD